MRSLYFLAGNCLNNCALPCMKGALNHISLELGQVLEFQRREFRAKGAFCLHRVGISPASGSVPDLIRREGQIRTHALRRKFANH